MPSVTVNGGSVEQTANPKNIAAVTTAVVTQSTTAPATGTYVLTLKDVPQISNYTVGMALTYNTKGTSNPNADNALTVTVVNGPAKYTCTGNWPVNT
jgi:hypothetical protein